MRDGLSGNMLVSSQCNLFSEFILVDKIWISYIGDFLMHVCGHSKTSVTILTFNLSLKSTYNDIFSELFMADGMWSLSYRGHTH